MTQQNTIVNPFRGLVNHGDSMNDLPFRVKEFDLLVGIMRKEKHGVYPHTSEPVGLWLSLTLKGNLQKSPLESLILKQDNPLLFY